MRRLITLAMLLMLAPAAMGSISFVGVASGTATSGTSVTVTIATTATDQLVMCTFETANITVTSISSANTWTQVNTIAQGTGRTECWVSPISSSAETSVVVNYSGTISDALAVVGEYSGGAAWGLNSTANSASATTMTNSLATEDNNNFVIGAFGVPSGSTISDSAGTRRSKPSAGSTQLWFGDNTSATPSSTALTITTVATHPYSSVMVELRTSGVSAAIGGVTGGPSTFGGPTVREP